MRPIREKFKKLLSSIRHRFGSYDEEVIHGIDLDFLQSSPNPQQETDTLIKITSDKLSEQSARYQQLMENYVILERYLRLDPNPLKYITNLCKQYSELLVTKNETLLKNEKLREKDAKVETYIANIPRAIDILKDHESHQQKVRKDLGILEGEQADLKYQFKHIKAALTFIKGLLIFMGFATLISGIVLSTMLFVYKQNIFIPAIISIVMITFVFLWAYISRRYLIHEIKKNQIMQERCVKLINKTRIKFVHNQQILEFQYKKYNVNSSEILELRYENYLELLHEEKIVHNLNHSLEALQLDLEFELNKAHIDDVGFIIEHIDFFATSKGVQKLMDHHIAEREQLQLSIQQLQRDLALLQDFRKPLAR